MVEMSSSDSDSDEFFDAKESWMSPTASPREKDNAAVHRCALIFTFITVSGFVCVSVCWLDNLRDCTQKVMDELHDISWKLGKLIF